MPLRSCALTVLKIKEIAEEPPCALSDDNGVRLGNALKAAATFGVSPTTACS